MLRKHFIFIAVVGCCLLFSGCDLIGNDGSLTARFAPGANPYLSIETDRETYSLPDTDYIGVTVVNHSKQTIYYNTCLPKVMEVLGNRGEVMDRIGMPVCYCLCITSLEPGEQINPELTRIPVSMAPEIEDRLGNYAGHRFRIRYEFGRDSGFSRTLPPSFSVSPVFTITDS